MESTPKVRELSQPGIRDLEKEELLGEPSEDLIELVALLASVQERLGGATRKSRRSSLAPSPPQGVEPRAESSPLTKRKAANQREPLQDSGGATREEEDRKRPRRQA